MSLRAVVYVPCFRRPELLWHCLDHLSRVTGEFAVEVIQDSPVTGNGSTEENLWVTQQFETKLGLVFRIRPPHQAWGCTYGVLSTLEEIAQCGYTHVMLLEEDVVVQPGILEVHNEIHHREQPWCVLSAFGGTYHSKFNAIGVSFPIGAVKALVATLPKSLNLGRNEPQFDAQVLRYLNQRAGYCRVKTCPRNMAWHVGWWGYNTGNDKLAPKGSLQERVQEVDRMIRNPETLLNSIPVTVQPPDWLVV